MLIVVAAFLLGLLAGWQATQWCRVYDARANATAPAPSPALVLPQRLANLSQFAPVSFVAEQDDDVLSDRVYWGPSVEASLPRGFSDEDDEAWTRLARAATIVRMSDGCGRMQNRLLTFGDGTLACCRYRQNTDQIQGDLLSFLLGRLLGLRNLAPAALSVVRPNESRWTTIKAQATLAAWADDHPAVLTRFVPGLRPAMIPRPFRGGGRLHPAEARAATLPGADSPPKELAQWSDLVVFDYLTANLDRVVNNLYNQQWNEAMMDSPAHNLAVEASTGLLVFLDNESGLLHGYRLLPKYEQYHRLLLDKLCVFRRSTIEALRRLHRAGDVADRLDDALRRASPSEPDILPGLPALNAKVLHQRIARVLAQVDSCEAQYTQ